MKRTLHLFLLILAALLLLSSCATERATVAYPISSSLPLPNRLPVRQPVRPEAPAVMSAPSAPESKSERRRGGEVIVIDPGHGGEDFGTHSTSKPRYQEKSLNLTTAKLLKGFLEQLGYKVVMTRRGDTFIALEKRAEFANEIDPILFVSVHYNSAPSKEAEGIEVFYYQKDADKKRVKKSKQLADRVLAGVLAQTNAKTRGVKHGNFAVIRQTKMPAVLVEGGFLTNENEMAKIKDPAYMKKVAWGIALGIDEYLNKNSN
jgi:N-acetylmuramoyl-L-alanine amidase